MRKDEPNLDYPIPGMGMTAELGSRLWEQPPQLDTVDEATDFYMERMKQEDVQKGLIKVIDMCVPLTTIANAIQLAYVMEGIHNIDVGVLMLPILVETMRYIAEEANIEYVTGMEEIKEKDDALALKVASKMIDEKEEIVEEEDVNKISETETTGVEIVKPPKGLMSRRVE